MIELKIITIIFYACVLVSIGVILGIGLMCLLSIAKRADNLIEKMDKK